MFGGTWRLGRLFGVEIRVDSSWVLIAVLIGWSYSIRLERLYGLEGNEALGLAVAATAVFFGSVLVHELAHSLAAKAMRIPVHGITLYLFGGATHANVESRGPKAEFITTIVGPLSSVGVAGVLWLAASAAGPDTEAIPGTLGYLAWINAFLAVFNLLPGLPLDGGRVLRSAVWGATGSYQRATRVAAIGGQVVGWAIVGVGAASVVLEDLGGLWLVFIGWFIAQAARAAGAQARQREVQRPPVPPVPPKDPFSRP